VAEVDWEALSPDKYEDMVAVLLSHMNPKVRRIDGSGGDGGRDAEFSRPDGPEISQLKSFTGRMDRNRKRKVEASLRKAAERNPVVWHLVVPIDPTPAEDEWFDQLRASYPFPLSWEGKTWLNAQMAERPFIPRYFLTGDSDRVVEMLKELNEEKAAVTDIPTGMQRLRALAGRINEMDPYYRFDVAVHGDTVEVSLIPRYEGAELDHPITVKLGLSFPDTDDGRDAAAEFQAAMDFGAPIELESQYVESVNIDAPAGIGGDFPGGGTLKFGPPQADEDWSMPIVLRVVTPADVLVAEVPVTLGRRSMGKRGFIAAGSDRAGTLAVEMRTNVETRQVNLNFRFSSTADHYPHDLLPALAFIRGSQSPNLVQVLLGDGLVPLGASIEAPTIVPVEEEFTTLVERLVRVQRDTSSFFPMPAEVSREDFEALGQVVDLLEGGHVQEGRTEASFVLDVADPQQFLQELSSKADGAAFLQESEESFFNFAGRKLPLGKMRTHLPEARVANMEEIRAQLEGAKGKVDLTVTIALEALGDKMLTRSLVRS
jgi:hypothetical protein